MTCILSDLYWTVLICQLVIQSQGKIQTMVVADVFKGRLWLEVVLPRGITYMGQGKGFAWWGLGGMRKPCALQIHVIIHWLPLPHLFLYNFLKSSDFFKATSKYKCQKGTHRLASWYYLHYMMRPCVIFFCCWWQLVIIIINMGKKSSF